MAKNNLIDIQLTCIEAVINPSGYNEVSVSLKDVDKGDILDSLRMDDILDYFGVEDILNSINQSEIFEHFKIEG